jgi:hypothetical protein
MKPFLYIWASCSFLLLSVCAFTIASCTVSIALIDSKGEASDLIDENLDPAMNIKADLPPAPLSLNQKF